MLGAACQKEVGGVGMPFPNLGPSFSWTPSWSREIIAARNTGNHVTLQFGSYSAEAAISTQRQYQSQTNVTFVWVIVHQIRV